MHFCVNDGAPLEPCELEGRDLEACPRCGFVLWRDPKVVTMVVVEDAAGRVVLGRRAIEPGRGLWCLPGGFVNDDEHPADAAIRECVEEIGVRVGSLGLLAVHHIPKRTAPSMVAIAYHGRLLAGDVPGAGPEMLEVAAFAPGLLPDLAFPSHVAALRDWRAATEGPPGDPGN